MTNAVWPEQEPSVVCGDKGREKQGVREKKNKKIDIIAVSSSAQRAPVCVWERRGGQVIRACGTRRTRMDGMLS